MREARMRFIRHVMDSVPDAAAPALANPVEVSESTVAAALAGVFRVDDGEFPVRVVPANAVGFLPRSRVAYARLFGEALAEERAEWESRLGEAEFRRLMKACWSSVGVRLLAFLNGRYGSHLAHFDREIRASAEDGYASVLPARFAAALIADDEVAVSRLGPVVRIAAQVVPIGLTADETAAWILVGGEAAMSRGGSA